MNQSDYKTYYLPAGKNILGHDCYREGDITPGNKFAKLINTREFEKYLGRSTIHDYPMGDEFKALLIKLAGSHGKVILKAYRIRKGLE